jgi:hypothetical protein
MPHIGTDAGCVNAYQDLVVPDERQRDVVEHQDVGRAVSVSGHCLDRGSPPRS